MEKLEILRKSDKGILDKLKTNSAGNLANQINRIDAKTKDKRQKMANLTSNTGLCLVF